MAQAAQPLVGRAAELGSLQEAIAALQRGGFAALEILGEPGIGKTRLLAELRAMAQERGLLVLDGSASELEEEMPFWVFVDALDEHVDSLGPRELRGLDDDAHAELPHVLPSLAGGGSATPVERYRTHRAMRSLLEALAPLVLLLDDLHWADSGSIELIGALLRRPPDAPVLLAMAARPRQLPDRLAGALQRARQDGTLRTLDLHALSVEEARELLGEGVEGAAAFDLFRRSGGNPFYLQQLARAPAASVAASLKDELSGVAGGARRVLEGAAVAGDPFEPELAAAAADVREESAVEALDELLQRDLIRATDIPRLFRFRHPLVRAAVYASAPGGWRLGAHDRCAAALAARGQPATARAHHVEHAGRHGDPDAVAVLAEAGEAMLSRAPDGAARWFEAALRLLAADAPAEQQLALLGSLARARAASGRYDDARQALADALELVPPGADDLRAGIVVVAASVDGLRSRHAEARARLLAEIERLEDRSPHARAGLMQYMTVNGIYRQDYADAQAWAERSRDAAAELGDPLDTAAAGALLALATSFTGPTAEAQRLRDETARIFDALPDERAAARVDGLSQLSAADFYLDRFAEGAVHSGRALALGRATGQLHLLPMLTPIHGALLTTLGRLDEARDVLEAGLEESRLTGNPQSLAWHLFALSLVELQSGDLDAAMRYAKESVELSRAHVTGMVAFYSSQILGMTQIELGEADRGAETMIADGGGQGLPLVPGGWRAYYLERLAVARLASGRDADAERAVATAREVAADTGLCIAVTAWRRAEAALALARGEPDAAAEHAGMAVTAAADVHARVHAALSRLLAGRALADAGRPDRAMDELQKAAADFEACGCRRWLAEAERELRKLGNRRVHRRSRPGTPNAAGVASLTERELEVARLIVDRRTNPQIAAELYLSPKTVESHVRNLFHKLGVASRVDVARAVERAERTADRTLNSP